METQGERLRWAREQAELRSAAAGARHCKVGESTYRSHENGSRKFGAGEAKKYGKFYNVSWPWLLGGEGKPDDSTAIHQTSTIPDESLGTGVADQSEETSAMDQEIEDRFLVARLRKMKAERRWRIIADATENNAGVQPGNPLKRGA
jgi:hypothetical protein